MNGELTYKGKKAVTPQSGYQPSKEVREFTAVVQKDCALGEEILNKPWPELNNLSVVDRTNRDQMTFNAFVDETIESPEEAWKWRGTRSKARNKAIAMHARLTAGYIVPMFMAQNESDEEDRDFSDIMRDITEWMADNSNYKSSFLMATMGMLVNPVTYLGAEYAQVYQTIKEKTDEGYAQKQIIDMVLSGFQAPVYGPTEILITNAFEQNIQKQRISKRRYVEYSEASAKYEKHENWAYVTPGQKSVYNPADSLFYDVVDDTHSNLIEETTYLDRRTDTEVCFLGGIYMGNSKSIDYNPIRHRDHRGAPKYNVVPFGYQRVSEHFYFYKSLMNAQYWDNNLLDAITEIGMNRAIVEAAMPIAVSGVEDKDVSSNVVFPNSVVAFASENAKVTPLLPRSDMGAVFTAINTTERSMDESSLSGPSGGQLPSGEQKATAIAIAEQNAKTMLQGVGKTLAESMVQFGGLMADIAVNHLTVPQIVELAGGKEKMKYPAFILTDKNKGGRSVSRVLRFDESLLGKEMTKEQKMYQSIELAAESGYPDSDKVIYRINPEMFSRMKYLTRIEPQFMFPKNEEFMQAMWTQLYTLLKDSPYITQEELTRRLLYPYVRGETDELMQKPDEMALLNSGQTGDKKSQAGNMALQRGLSKGISPTVPMS